MSWPVPYAKVACLAGWLAVSAAGCSPGPKEAASSDETKVAWSDAELQRVRSGEISTLTAPNATVTDADLAKLAGLSKLERLKLDSVKITDAGFVHLAGLTKLQALHVTDQKLGDCVIGDTGIKTLANMPDLEELLLPSPNATDAATETLAKLAKLRILNLGVTRITDTGIERISALPKLELLRVGGPTLSDAALEHMAKIATLKQLLLHDAPFTDAELGQLLALDKLESLYIDRTMVTAEGLSPIAKQKPNWHIHLDDKHVGGEHHDHEP